MLCCGGKRKDQKKQNPKKKFGLQKQITHITISDNNQPSRKNSKRMDEINIEQAKQKKVSISDQSCNSGDTENKVELTSLNIIKLIVPDILAIELCEQDLDLAQILTHTYNDLKNQKKISQEVLDNMPKEQKYNFIVSAANILSYNIDQEEVKGIKNKKIRTIITKFCKFFSEKKQQNNNNNEEQPPVQPGHLRLRSSVSISQNLLQQIQGSFLQQEGGKKIQSQIELEVEQSDSNEEEQKNNDEEKKDKWIKKNDSLDDLFDNSIIQEQSIEMDQSNQKGNNLNSTISKINQSKDPKQLSILHLSGTNLNVSKPQQKNFQNQKSDTFYSFGQISLQKDQSQNKAQDDQQQAFNGLKVKKQESHENKIVENREEDEITIVASTFPKKGNNELYINDISPEFKNRGELYIKKQSSETVLQEHKAAAATTTSVCNSKNLNNEEFYSPQRKRHSELIAPQRHSEPRNTKKMTAMDMMGQSQQLLEMSTLSFNTFLQRLSKWTQTTIQTSLNKQKKKKYYNQRNIV